MRRKEKKEGERKREGGGGVGGGRRDCRAIWLREIRGARIDGSMEMGIHKFPLA